MISWQPRRWLQRLSTPLHRQGRRAITNTPSHPSTAPSNAEFEVSTAHGEQHSSKDGPLIRKHGSFNLKSFSKEGKLPYYWHKCRRSQPSPAEKVVSKAASLRLPQITKPLRPGNSIHEHIVNESPQLTSTVAVHRPVFIPSSNPEARSSRHIKKPNEAENGLLGGIPARAVNFITQGFEAAQKNWERQGSPPGATSRIRQYTSIEKNTTGGKWTRNEGYPDKDLNNGIENELAGGIEAPSRSFRPTQVTLEATASPSRAARSLKTTSLALSHRKAQAVPQRASRKPPLLSKLMLRRRSLTIDDNSKSSSLATSSSLVGRIYQRRFITLRRALIRNAARRALKYKHRPPGAYCPRANSRLQRVPGLVVRKLDERKPHDLFHRCCSRRQIKRARFLTRKERLVRKVGAPSPGLGLIRKYRSNPTGGFMTHDPIKDAVPGADSLIPEQLSDLDEVLELYKNDKPVQRHSRGSNLSARGRASVSFHRARELASPRLFLGKKFVPRFWRDS